jgi:hypothetical protein
MQKSLRFVPLVMITAALLLSACNGKATPAATEAPAVAELATTQEPQAPVEMLAYPYPGAAQPVAGGNFASPYPQPGGGDTQVSGSAGATLLASLQSAGLSAAEGGDVSQSFFSVPGKVLLLGSDELQVYEYATPEAAAADVQSVSADGKSVGAAVLDWISTPHFFSSGNVVLIYVGENSTILQTLQSMFGTQFAGG